MAAYTAQLNDLYLDVETTKYATSFTHTSASYNAQYNNIKNWVENLIGDDSDTPITPPPTYIGIVDSEITYYIDNQIAGPWSPIPPEAIPVMLETELTQWLDDATAKWLNPATDLVKGRRTNIKLTGIIYPRLYDWTGRRYGTFR